MNSDFPFFFLPSQPLIYFFAFYTAFMEIQLTHPTIHPLKVYSSLDYCAFTVPQPSPQSVLDPHPSEQPHTCEQALPIPVPCCPSLPCLRPQTVWPLWICLFLTFCVKQNSMCNLLPYLLSLRALFSRFIQAALIAGYCVVWICHVLFVHY